MSFPFEAPSISYPSDTRVGRNSFEVRPAWGLLGTAVGTIAAILLVPAVGFDRPHALVPSGLALTAGLLLGPILSARHDTRTAFRAEHVLLIGLVYWLMLDALQSNTARLWDVSHETVERVFLHTGLFASALWIGSSLASLLFAPGRTQAPPPPDLGALFLFRAGLVCFLFGFAEPTATCGFSMSCLVDALSAPRFEVPWFSGPGIKGLNTVLANLKYFGYVLLPILVALHRVEGRSRRVFVLALLTLLFLLLLLRDGGRKELGTVLGAGLLTWILLQGRLRLRHYGLMLAAIAGALMLLQVMVSWRDVGVTRAFEGNAQKPATYSGVMVDWSFDWLAHVIQVVPERAPHVGSRGITYALGYQIPRSVWTTKPPPHGIDLNRYTGRTYGPTFSWNCTVVGDLYLIGGALAVFIGGMLYGGLANFTSRLLLQPVSVRSRLLYAVAVMALFLTLRALWEFTAQGVTVLAVWALLMSHWFVRRPQA